MSLTETILGLRRKGTEKLFSWEWNAVLDGLDILYGNVQDVGKRGSAEKPFQELYGYYGYFFYDLEVQGKKVIKDGDPVNIYDIFEPAKQRITQAIDSARVTQNSDLLAGYAERIPRIESIQKDIRSYLDEVRRKVGSIRTDEYGNVGVIIAEPRDEYGYVLVRAADPDAELLPASGEIDTSVETSPLEVIVPPPDKRIDVRRAFLGCNSTNGVVYAKFKNSGKIITSIYLSKYGYTVLPAIRIPGDVGEPVVIEWSGLDTGAKITYLFNYKLI